MLGCVALRRQRHSGPILTDFAWAVFNCPAHVALQLSLAGLGDRREHKHDALPAKRRTAATVKTAPQARTLPLFCVERS